MTRYALLVQLTIATLLACSTPGVSADDTYSSPAAKADGPIVLQVVTVEDKDEKPAAAGKQAAEALKKAMGDTPLKAVVVSECFEDRENKERVLEGVCSVLPKDVVFGGATYGSFTQKGCTGFDSVCLLGIGGEGIGVSAALVTEMGASKLKFEEHQAEIEKLLHAAGAKLAEKLPKSKEDRLVILIPDAHAPKNACLVEGVQKVICPKFPITGGSANKNAGQTFVYFRGRMHDDAAVALMLSGDFQVALSGRQAKENDAVIASAKAGAAEALAAAKGKPIAVLAYNCAGRRSKLKKMEEELAAIQSAIGKDILLFGCYNAGEIGPLDTADKKPDVLCGGSGWHVMFTVIGK
jgi:hypothetical protein